MARAGSTLKSKKIISEQMQFPNEFQVGAEDKRDFLRAQLNDILDQPVSKGRSATINVNGGSGQTGYAITRHEPCSANQLAYSRTENK